MVFGPSEARLAFFAGPLFLSRQLSPPIGEDCCRRRGEESGTEEWFYGEGNERFSFLPQLKPDSYDFKSSSRCEYLLVDPGPLDSFFTARHPPPDRGFVCLLA